MLQLIENRLACLTLNSSPNYLSQSDSGLSKGSTNFNFKSSVSSLTLPRSIELITTVNCQGKRSYNVANISALQRMLSRSYNNDNNCILRWHLLQMHPMLYPKHCYR